MRILTALASAALVGLAAGMPVSGELVSRTAAPGIQLWSGADFTGNFYHYTSPEIRYDTCCKCPARSRTRSHGRR